MERGHGLLPNRAVVGMKEIDPAAVDQFRGRIAEECLDRGTDVAANPARIEDDDDVVAVLNEGLEPRFGRPLGRFRHDTRRRGIERARQVRLALGLVDGRVRRGIDDDVGPHGRHGVGQLLGPTEVGMQVGAVEVQRDQFAQGRQAALQFPADLATLSEKEDLHAAPYCLLTQSR